MRFKTGYQFIDYTDRVLHYGERVQTDMLSVIGLKLQRELKEILSLPESEKHGEEYWKGKNKDIRHVASAAGEPPALDTGRLRASIQFEIEEGARSKKSLTVGSVRSKGTGGTLVEYGDYLEFGTSKMAPRPWVSVIIARYSGDAGRERLMMDAWRHLIKTGKLKV